MFEELKQMIGYFGEQIGSVLYLNKENPIHEIHFQVTSNECLYLENLKINGLTKTLKIEYSLNDDSETIKATKYYRKKDRPGTKEVQIPIDHDQFFKVMYYKIFQGLVEKE